MEEYGLAVIGGCCGTTPEHIRLLADRYAGREVMKRSPESERSASSLYIEVPFAQDASHLNIGERTNDNVIKTVTLNLGTEALNGIWKLRVNDNGAGDTGYINQWSVTF